MLFEICLKARPDQRARFLKALLLTVIKRSNLVAFINKTLFILIKLACWPYLSPPRLA
ncbi:hypothetical protein X474_03970 [Dethiosulfatarculus sandiegensis]|uniref:Uncharacterized protein n=1 Tax=Dethiosulfatarculus sandiegensis TaxID=1429043 RepID=A0A0D2HYU6_9BACT|nr:hypothetical protein X474_03970 [Dethiosulfatarculus sandiegensis]